MADGSYPPSAPVETESTWVWRAHLAACGAWGEKRYGGKLPTLAKLSSSSRGPAWGWEPVLTMLSSPGWLLRESSFRPSGQRCPLSGSHSAGVFSREHNGDAKAAGHTRGQWTTKLASEKHPECKCNVQTRLHFLFVAESLWKQAPSPDLYPCQKRVLVKISSQRETSVFCLICSNSRVDLDLAGTTLG